MNCKLEDIIDIPLLQSLQEKLNNIYSFPSAIIDLEGNILTAVAWQDICTKFHRKNPECEKECIKSDQYIMDHLPEADPAVSYTCPHGLVDNATPIFINGSHLGNFFTGQFFLKEPDLDFFRMQAVKYGFDEEEYLKAVAKVPVWSKEKLDLYLDFIKGFIGMIADIGIMNLKESEIKKQLKESEDKFRLLFEQAPLGYQSLDVNGNLLEANEKWLNMLGYSREEVIGKWFGEFLAPGSRENFCLTFPLSEFRDNIHHDFEMVHKNGSRLFITLEGKISFDVNGDIRQIHCILQDVTEKITAQNALEESNQFNRHIINNIEQGLIVYDKDLRYKVWNPAMERLSGIPASEVLGRYPADLFPFLEDAGVMTSLKKALSGEPSGMITFPFRVPVSGKTGWTSDRNIPLRDIKGQIIGVLGTVEDQTYLKNAEKELSRANEESARRDIQFKEFFEKAADPIIVAEIETGIILAANQAATKLLKLPRDKIRGLHQSRLHPTDTNSISIEHFLEHVNAVKTGAEVKPFEDTVIRSDGSVVPVEILAAKVFYDGRECIMGTFRDISLRKEKDKELKKLIGNLNFHLENTPLGVIEFNNRQQITRWSPKSEKIFGWKEEEVLGKTVDEIEMIYKDDLKLVNKIRSELLTKVNSNTTSVNRNKRKDGCIITCEWYNSAMYDENGSLLSLHSLIQDITGRKILEERLVHSHNLMRYIIEHNRGAVAVHDRDLNYVYVSQRYLIDYNVKEENILGRHHYEIFPDLPQKWRDVHQKALKGEISSAEDDPWVRDNGTTEWTRWECRPWYESDGSIGGIIIYTEVITRQKEAEIALKKAKEKAEESDRLKTSFLRNMSHEIRTPLNGIVGLSQILVEFDGPADKKRQYAEMIVKCSDKLIEIISDVTDMALIQSNQIGIDLSEFNFITYIKDLVSSSGEKAESKNNKLVFRQNIEDENLRITTDASKLTKIINHLVDNALKFTDNGIIEIKCQIDENDLVISVSDTGIGIIKEKLKVIFEPFIQVDHGPDTHYGGNGLGLALVKEYTRLLNGNVSIESEPGQGTTIVVTLPLKNFLIPPAIVKTKKNQVPVNNIPKTEKVRTILIAEDELTNYLYLKELLCRGKNKIIHAANGRIAVEICSEVREIDLILMDLKMPVMDGETAARHIKKFRPDLPIIAQTAYILENDMNKPLSVFDDYLTKPIKSEVLHQKVRRFINI